MKEKFKKLAENLQKQPKYAAETLKKIFPDGLKMKWADNIWIIRGLMTISNQGVMTEIEMKCN